MESPAKVKRLHREEVECRKTGSRSGRPKRFPTGRLHPGHWAGSLQNRVRLQYGYDASLIIADLPVLTTKNNPNDMREKFASVLSMKGNRYQAVSAQCVVCLIITELIGIVGMKCIQIPVDAQSAAGGDIPVIAGGCPVRVQDR